MKITLNLNDEKMRTEAKAMLLEQVKSITRSEVNKVVMDEVRRKVKTGLLEREIKNIATSEIEKILGIRGSYFDRRSDTIVSYAKFFVKKIVKEELKLKIKPLIAKVLKGFKPETLAKVIVREEIQAKLDKIDLKLTIKK